MELCNCSVTTICAVIGGLYLAKVAAKLIGGFASSLMNGAKSPRYYGSWVVITGATDGIGKALAFEFAKKGMNLLLISRTQKKLDDTSSEIKEKFGVQAKTLAIDFSKFDKAAQDKVKAEMESLDDMGILVNNVGCSYPFPMYLTELSDEEVSGLLELNVNSLTVMTKLALPILEKKKKGCIWNIGSAAGLHPSPLLAIYSATKAYVETLSVALNTEYAPKGICVQCHVPLFVVSKLSKYKKESGFVPSSETYAKEAIAMLGTSSVISPHFPHRVASFIMDCAPAWVVQKGSLSFHLGIRSKGMKKRAREAAAAAGK